MNKKLAQSLVDKHGNYLGNNTVGLDDGYQYFRFSGSTFKQMIHRLVALAYGDKPIEGMHVHHIDENKLNNNIDNLMILTPSEHTIIHLTGSEPYNKGISKPEIEKFKNTVTKLKDKIDLNDIDSIKTSTDSYRALGRKYKIDPGTVKKIKENPEYYIEAFETFG